MSARVGECVLGYIETDGLAGGLGEFDGAVAGSAAYVERSGARGKPSRKRIAREMFRPQVIVDLAWYDALAREFDHDEPLSGNRFLRGQANAAVHLDAAGKVKLAVNRLVGLFHL